MDTILSESHCQTFHFREKVHNFFSLYNAIDFPIWIHDANKRENGKSYPPITKYYVPSDEYTQNWVFGFREMDWLKTHFIFIAWKKICCSAIKTVIIWMCSCVENNSYLNLIKERKPPLKFLGTTWKPNIGYIWPITILISLCPCPQYFIQTHVVGDCWGGGSTRG